MEASAQEIRSYYDNHVDKKLRDFQEGNKRVERAWETVRLWSPQQPQRILEVGCGVGYISWRMSQYWPDSEVIGFDISPKSIETAKELFSSPNLSFIEGKLTSDELSDQFDLIVLMDVYEHIKVDERAELHLVLKERLNEYGRIILSFPTPRHLAWLRKYKPDQIQPVDEDITAKEIMKMALDVNQAILLYQEIGVWGQGDYAHAVLGKVSGWSSVERPKLQTRELSNFKAVNHKTSVLKTQAASTDFPKYDDFLNPPLSIQNIDRYLPRSSILKALKQTIPFLHGILLDVGCGEMPYKSLLTAQPSKVTKYIGLDIENPIYQQRVRPDIFWDGKQIDLSDNSVDCAIATEFLEHIPDPLAVLREIQRVLKPEGLFFLTVPFLWPLHTPPHDEYRYTPYALERLLKQAGFSEINLKALGGWDASLAQMIGLWLKRRPMADAERAKFTEMLFPLYQELIEQDEPPLQFWSQMITGLSGTAVKSAVASTQRIEYPTSKKKVVIVPGAFPKLSATFILDQITGLIDRGFEVELWPSYNPQENVLHPDVRRYDLLNKTRYLRFPPDTLRRTPALWVEQFCHWNQVTPADLAGIDAFHIQFGENFNRLAPLLQTLDTNVVVSFHGYDATKYVQEHGEHCYADLFERANLITTPSHRMKEMLVQYGCSAHKIVVHRCGIDLNKFAPSQSTAAGLESTLLTVGRLVEKKGVEDSLRAFAQLPDRSNLHYRIVGDGELRPHLEALAAQLGIRGQVTFVGSCTRGQVVEEMAQADIFILTSFTAANGDQEGLPVSLIEAQATGVPVVSSHHAGIPELVQHGQTGFLAPERDIAAIAGYLQRLVADPDLRRVMATNARRRVEKEFDIDLLNDKLAYYLSGGRPAKEDAGRAILSKTELSPVIRQQPAAGQNSKEATAEAGKRFCPVCQKSALQFLPFGVTPRPNARCPHCGSLEQHRLLWLYLRTRSSLFNWRFKMLDVAPTPVLTNIFKSLPNLDYLSIDLESPLAMRHMDLTQLDLPDDEFDFVLCYHVLEHIPDDRKAMAELFRVLKPGGSAIIQMPLKEELETTLEDLTITDPKERERLYGQLGHVRQYGRDYKDRLEQAGFRVVADDFAAQLSAKDTERFALQPDERLYCCYKPLGMISPPDVGQPEPTISIVIPTYNRAQFIGDALASALAQTVPATEIVVVDDGSIDDTADVVAKLGGSRVRYVKKEHSGGPATRNRCVQEARGDYLLWLDSDDVLLPDAVAHHLAAWRQAPDADVFYGDAIFTNEQLQPIQLQRYYEWYHQNQLLVAQMFLGNCIPNNGTMVRNACYDWVGGYSEAFPRAHDFEMWFRLLDRAIFKNTGATLVFRRMHSGPALSGTVKNVDLRYEVTIAHGLLERYSLRQLTPNIAWDKQPAAEAQAAATMLVALKLIQINDFHGTLAYVRQSQAYQDTAQVHELIDKLATLLDSGQVPPVERVPLVIPSRFHAEHRNAVGTLQHSGGRDAKASVPSSDTPTSDIRVTAIIAAYNEGDIIYHSIRDLVEQGIAVYFIDHHSTDNTLAEVKKWLDRGVIGIETFPEESGFDVPNDVYTWRFMLQRKEQLVREMGPGWYIHFDADEFRESPWLGVSLKQGIARVEAEGYNAINFKMLDFKPTDDNFQPGRDVRDYLRYYDPNIHPANKLKINCWKYEGQTFNLWQSGGHSVEFAGRKVYPTLFLMRHYPIRSQAHGERKVFEDRKKRFDKDEKRAQWHAQYDDIADTNHCFIEDKANLILFDRARLCRELSGEVQADNSKPGPTLNGKQPQPAKSAAVASPQPAPVVKTAAKPPAQYYEFPRPEVQAMVSPSAKHILDVGCAAGRMAFELKQKLGAEVWGIEIVPEVARLAEQRLDRVIIGGVEAALTELPDGYFDTVIFADVLEHLVDPYTVIETLKTKLTPYGEIVASIPNIRHWSILKDLLEGRWDYQEAGLLDRTHLRFFTRKSVIELFERAGFRLEQIGYTHIEGYGVPPEVLQALAATDLDLSTLQEEGQHYQYLVRAKLEPRVMALTSIIILTHNQLQHTKLCLESIAVHTPQPHELIVVDNGSTDGTLDYLRAYAEENPQMRIIANAENRGFAAGNNQGLAAAKGDYVLLLNNDTVVTKGWLARMLEIFERYPDVGIVGPVSNYVSGLQLVREAAYQNLEEMHQFATNWAIEHTGQTMEIYRVVGFCLLARRAVIDRIGGLDEQFGSGNFEDDDFCIRAALAGFKARIAQDVFIHHTGNQTFKGAGIDYHQSMQRNWELFKAKWGIPLETPLEAGYQLSLEAFKSKQYFIPLPAETKNDRSKTPESSSANTLILFAHEKASTQRLTHCLTNLESYHSPSKKLVVKVVNPPTNLSLTSSQFNLNEAIENTPTAALHAALNSGEPYVVLLAADVTITKNWLDRLIAIADSDPTIAVIGPTSNAAPTPQQIKKGYRSLKKDLQTFAAKRANKYGHTWEEVAYLGGFCLLLKSHQVRVVGGLDDSLPLSEALWDLYQRLQQYGFKLVCAQGVYVHHRRLTEQEGATYEAFASTQQAAAKIFTAGEQALEQGDFDPAIEIFTQMTEQFPHLTAGYTALGSTLLALDRCQEATPHLRQAALLSPQVSALHNQLGIALYRSGQQAEAAAAFQEARWLDPTDIEPLLNLIDLYRAWEDYAVATEMLKAALSLAPDHPDVLVAFGILSLELGDIDGAQQALQHLREAPPDHPGIIALQQALGSCQLPDAQTKSTVESRQPDSSTNLEEIRSRVETAQAQENWSQAIELLQDTLKQEVSPEDEAYLWNSLGYCYVRANLPAEAEISFKQGLETTPDHLHLLSNLADLYLQQERFDQATEYLNRALAVDPDDTNILLSLGQCCIQLSVFDTALLAFRRVQTLAPETEGIDQVVAELETLVVVPV